jgi:hypothetical protein
MDLVTDDLVERLAVATDLWICVSCDSLITSLVVGSVVASNSLGVR